MPILGDWNHVYVEGDDWSQTDILNLYRTAFDERLRSGGTFPVELGSTFGLSAVPIPVADWYFWWAMMFFPMSLGGGDAWVVNKDHTGQAELTRVDWDYLKTHALGGRDGFTRKYEKKFRGMTATEYADGTTAFANGDYARNTVDRKTYLRSAGAWVVAPGHLPDVISTFGVHAEGDIITIEMLNEIRDVYNLLTAWGSAPLTLPWSSGDLDVGGASGDGSTVAAMKADTEAAYLASITEADAGFTPQALAVIEYDGSGSYTGVLIRRRGKITTTGNTWAIYFSVDFYSVGINSASGQPFENSGDPVLEGLLCKWDTKSGVGDGADIVSEWMGSMTVPTWPPDPTVAGTVARGYEVDQVGLVFRFDVDGGFQCRP
jgi:hypothetical protein